MQHPSNNNNNSGNMFTTPPPPPNMSVPPPPPTSHMQQQQQQHQYPPSFSSMHAPHNYYVPPPYPRPPSYSYPPPPMMPAHPPPPQMQSQFHRPPVYHHYPGSGGGGGGGYQPCPYTGYQMSVPPPLPPVVVAEDKSGRDSHDSYRSRDKASSYYSGDKKRSWNDQSDYSTSKRTRSRSPGSRRYERSDDNRTREKRREPDHRRNRDRSSSRGRSRSSSRDRDRYRHGKYGRSSPDRGRSDRYQSSDRQRYSSNKYEADDRARSSRDRSAFSSRRSSNQSDEAASAAGSRSKKGGNGQSADVKFFLHKSESETEENENENEDADKTVEPAPEEEDRNASDYIQTTQIPIYYTKDPAQPARVRATGKLVDLCNKFESEIVERSTRERAKMNLPLEATQIPDYRQLVTTKKFNKFAQCTCDKSASGGGGHGHGDHDHEAKSTSTTGCSKHSRSRMLKRLGSKEKSVSSGASSSSSSSRSSSSSSSASSYSSGGSSVRSRSSSSSAATSSSKNSTKTTTTHGKTKEKEDEDEFEDIRSMEINRKQKHPERLHSELCFNEPDQTNEGPLCKCKLKNTKFGTRHQIYYGEKVIPVCDDYSNNSDRLVHYRMSITPFKDFVTRHPTKIEFDNHEYVFEGYSLFAHEPIEPIPDCVVVIYNNEYKLNLVQEPMIENFTVREIELLKRFVLVELLELYDLKWKGFELDETCNRFHVMPRFCRPLQCNGKELLSPCEILKYFLKSSAPVVSASVLNKCHLYSEREWLSYVEGLQGSIVTCPGRRPAAIRLDQLDRDQIVRSLAGVKDKQAHKNEKYPLIIHFNMFRNNWLPIIKNNMKLKKLYHKYFKLRHLQNNKSKLSEEDKTKRRALEDELQALVKKKATDYQKEIMIELSSENFLRTGMRTDMVQQAVLLPTFVEHLRFHISLKYLEEKIGYRFKNRLLLQFALTHPSGAFLLHQNLGSNPDHIRNTLFNCKVRNPNYGELTPKKRKLLLRKKGIHMLFSIMSQKALDTEELSCISNYERLEFLGDKILELLTSKHLFFLFPQFDEGQLSEYRNALVQNQYLAVLAKKLDMQYFIIFYHGVDLCSNSALNHALANSFEALLAAIFLDSDLDTVSAMLAKTLWYDDPTGLYSVWQDLPLHPIQAQMPDGDRHLIASTKILEHVNVFEEMIGVEFKHVRLLAQAFCTRSASFNLITLGDNQRLEFLGDTVLNFVVSDYLYRHFPNHHEGHLSLLRSSLVCNSTQALLYDELGMADFVLTSYINNRKEPNGHLKRKADVFEAFVGALYIDQGLEAVTAFCNVCIFNKLQDIILYQFWNDPKSRLQQCCLSLRDVDESKPSLPTYKLIEEKGPPNHKQYKVAVYFNRKRIGEGIGKSIHDAEVGAAKNALKTKADMFPVLNKYVASKLKASNYISFEQLEEESTDNKSKRTKSRAEEPATVEAPKQQQQQSAPESLKESLLNKKGSLIKKFVNN